MSRGNVTAYEYIFGDAPLKIEEPVMLSLETEENPVTADDEICLDLGLSRFIWRNMFFPETCFAYTISELEFKV